MRVAWHDGIDFFFSSVGHDENKVLQVALDVFHLVHLRTTVSLHSSHLKSVDQAITYQPDPHIRSNLIVPAPASVQLATNILANNLRQTPLIRRMDILIIRENLEFPVLPLLFDLLETAFNLFAFLLSEDTGLFETSGMRDGSLHIGGVHPLVVGERLVVLVHPVFCGSQRGEEAAS